jgi:transposase
MGVCWIGYKIHVTESCDVDTPHVVTHVETTPSPKADVDMTEPIHKALYEGWLSWRNILWI